jgi:acyl-coenzyme A synthetase/AMP-(fatty) acid ligase
MVNSAFAAGASVALASYSPSSHHFWEYLDHAGGTCVGAVPATYAFLRAHGWDPAGHPALRLLLHAGGALDEATRAYHAGRMAAQGGEFVSMYGQTEATARISYLPAALGARYPGSSGVAIPGGRISIERPGGVAAGAGETGEIVFAGPGVMMGYATSRADLARGDVQGDVLHTGDLGYLRDGLLYVTGRLDRQVKVFGLRIDLDQVEIRLASWGLAAAVEVVGDERLVVVAEPSAALTDACRALARELRLPSVAVCLETVSRLPYNGRGKIDRRAVRQLLHTGVDARSGGDE